MDISSVITANIDAYLKPKYPIYRITYIHSKHKYNYEDGHGESYIKTTRKIGLFEYVGEEIGSTNICFEENKFCKNIIDGFNEQGFYMFNDQFYASNTWTVIGLEKLA